MHFALIGLALFAASRLLPGESEVEAADEAQNPRIVISASRVVALVRQYEATNGIATTDAMRAELIQGFADDEMLIREAHRRGLASHNRAVDHRLREAMAFASPEVLPDEELVRQGRALGLDSRDPVIRSMLAHNMRLLLAREGERPPSDEDLEAYYATARTRFARPSRLTGWHVFFSKDLRGSSAQTDARAAGARLTGTALAPEEAVELGDPSPRGAHFEGQLVRQLESRFGQAFAKVADSAPVGEWSTPVETPFGVHLMLIEEHTQPQAPPLSEIRARVIAAYQSSQRKERLAAAMEALHARYEVVVE